MSYLILAGISTPLVLSVHSTVSFDFATSLIPGWHTTIFPPYFVAGAIFGGFAMVLTLLIPSRALFKLHDVITWNHIDVMCKITLLTGSMVGYSYCMEFFVAYYGADPFERYIFLNRYFGPYWWVGYGMFIGNVSHAAALLGARFSEKCLDGLLSGHVRKRGHVVRALCDYCHVAASRFFAFELANVLSDLG